MDPISIFGVVAGAVQLLDASIKASKKSRLLISNFRHAADSIQHLERAMKEAEALMNDLQTFALAAQQVPPDQIDQQSHILSSSVYQIALNYSGDIKNLGSILPSASSLHIKERFSFARNQKAITDIIVRLEERKTSATLALEILGGIEDMKQETRGLELKRGLHALSLGQVTLSADLSRSFDAVTNQNQKIAEAETNILHSMQQLQGLVLRGEQVNTQNQNLLSDQANQLSHIETRLSDVLSGSEESLSTLARLQRDVKSHSSEVQTSLASMEATTISRSRQLATTSQVKAIAASSANELGKIVRLELKKQLEPLRSRLEVTDHIIDGLATAIAANASHQKAFEGISEPATEQHSSGKEFGNLDGRISGKSNTLGGDPNVGPSRRTVRLFTYYCFRQTVFGNLNVRITTYRSKGLPLQDAQSYFLLNIDFIPKPWLLSKGVSMLYTSRPSADGYLDICPRLRTFGVLPVDSPFLDFIYQDNVSSFQEALETRQIGLWDVNTEGDNLLAMSLDARGLDIARYLLSTRYARTLIADTDMDVAMFLFCMLANLSNLTGGHQMLSLVEENSDRHNELEEVISIFFWHKLWNRKCRLSKCFDSNPPPLESRQWVLLAKEYGIFLKPEHFLNIRNWKDSVAKLFDDIEFLMQLYLTTGGDPNYSFENGTPLLVGIFRQTRVCTEDLFFNSDLDHRSNADGESISDASETTDDSGSYTGTSNSVDFCSADRSECLARDVSDNGFDYSNYSTQDDDSGPLCAMCSVKRRTDDCNSGHHHSLFILAKEFDVLDIWTASLRKCGHSPDEVHKETLRRMREVDQTGGARCTSVHVTSIVEKPDVRDVRFRGHGRRFDED